MTEVRTSTKFADLCLICQTRLAWRHRKWAFQPLLLMMLCKTDVTILHNHNDGLMYLFTVQRFVIIDNNLKKLEGHFNEAWFSRIQGLFTVIPTHAFTLGGKTLAPRSWLKANKNKKRAIKIYIYKKTINK